eukprot:gene19755-22460_t
MSREFIIVRHSERLDEVAPQEWLESLKSNTSLRDRFSLENDTPITAEGVNMAADAARTVRDLITSKYSNSTPLVALKIRIYSSRLMRCVQTAHQIAQELNLPIHICSGLSLTAVAVSRRKGTFEFQTMEELTELCPGSNLVSGDHRDSPHYVSRSDWKRAIHSIASRDEINIIVAHRETIRNLIGERFRLPYCAIGLFRYNFHDTSVVPLYILDKDGRMIEDYSQPTDSTTVGAVGGESLFIEDDS